MKLEPDVSVVGNVLPLVFLGSGQFGFSEIWTGLSKDRTVLVFPGQYWLFLGLDPVFLWIWLF
jgi:hypothetical protein